MSLMQALAGDPLAPVITWRSTATDGLSASSNRTVTLDIGPESSDRWVIVHIEYTGTTLLASHTITLSSMTINGVTPTYAYIGTSNTSIQTLGGAIVYAKMPNGSGSGLVTVNAVLTVTSGGTPSITCRFHSWTVTGRQILSYVTRETSGTLSGVTTMTNASTCPSFGFLINVCYVFNSGVSDGVNIWSGTGAGEDYHNSTGGASFVSTYNGTRKLSQSLSTTATISAARTGALNAYSWTYI